MKKMYYRSNKNQMYNVVKIISFVYPLTALPQVLQIWVGKDASGVSISSWIMFLAFSIPLLWYAFAIKNKNYKIMYSLWMIVYALVIIGAIIYR